MMRLPIAALLAVTASALPIAMPFAASAQESSLYDLDGRMAAAQLSYDRAQLLEQQLLPHPDGAAQTASMDAARSAAQQKLALSPELETCGAAAHQVAVLPPDDSGKIAVYLLNFPAAEHAVPLGGHFRVEVDADGQAGQPEPLTAGCDIVQWYPADAQLMMQVYVTEYTLADHPAEIHSLISKRLPMSMGVITGDLIWPMAGGYIAPPVPAEEAGY